MNFHFWTCTLSWRNTFFIHAGLQSDSDLKRWEALLTLLPKNEKKWRPFFETLSSLRKKLVNNFKQTTGQQMPKLGNGAAQLNAHRLLVIWPVRINSCRNQFNISATQKSQILDFDSRIKVTGFRFTFDVSLAQNQEKLWMNLFFHRLQQYRQQLTILNNIAPISEKFRKKHWINLFILLGSATINHILRRCLGQLGANIWLFYFEFVSFCELRNFSWPNKYCQIKIEIKISILAFRKSRLPNTLRNQFVTASKNSSKFNWDIEIAVLNHVLCWVGFDQVERIFRVVIAFDRQNRVLCSISQHIISMG